MRLLSKLLQLRPAKLLPALTIAVAPALAAAATLDRTGLPHFFQVSEHVFRGAQPETTGWKSLAGLGVETVIDLRPEAEHDIAAEQRMVTAAGMRYVNIPMPGLETPTPEQIQAALELMSPDDTVFVHCARGKDRTGAVIAAYRMRHQQWSNQKALDEARSLGLHWYERGKMKFILAYQPPAARPVVADSLSVAKVSPSPADSLGRPSSTR